MTATRRRSVLLMVIGAIVLSMQCHRLTGSAEDPMDREADDALTAYIRIDTSNPPGNESAGARFLQQLLEKNGIQAQLVGSDPRRQGVYARLRSGSDEKALLLLSHIDVVPALGAEWTRPPFGGVHASGYIWGRGALDIKSLGIAQAMAMIELKRRNLPLARDVIFLAVPDEEAGGLHGCGDLLAKSPALFDGVGFVLNEGGSNETVVDRVTLWGIEVQQKVPLWIRLHAKGAPGHAAAPPDDGGASAKLVRALSAVLDIETPFRLTPGVGAYFRSIGATRRDERGEVLRNIGEEISGTRFQRVLSSSYRALLRDTIAVTHLAAGTSVNSLPANAVAEVDIRLLPDETPEAMLAKVRQAAAGDAEVEVLVAGEPAPDTSSDTELFHLLRRELERTEGGSRVAATVGAGATDSRFFRKRGVVAYGMSPFKVNYYDAGTAHGDDERIRTQFFVEGVRLMRRIVVAFCARGGGVPDAASR